MKLSQLVIPAALWLLLSCCSAAPAQTTQSIDSPAVAKKVTVTLVRWPYT